MKRNPKSKMPMYLLVGSSIVATPALAEKLTIHVVAVNEIQLVSIVDEVAKTTIYTRERFAKDETKFPKIETDSSGKGHISWNSVSLPDDKGLCRFGHGDQANLDDSTAVNIAVTSGLDNCPK